MLSTIIKELIVVFMVGFLPLFTAYWLGGIDQLNTIVSMLLAQDFSMIHAVILSSIFFIAKFLNHYIYFKKDNQRKFVSGACAIFEEVGNSTLTIIRVGAGVLIGFPILWLIYDIDTFDSSGAVFFLYGVIALIDACFLSMLHDYIKNKWRAH